MPCPFHRDAASRLLGAVKNNPKSSLTHLDLSYNRLDDQCMESLCQVLSSLPHGLSTLELADCGITLKGIAQLLWGIVQPLWGYCATIVGVLCNHLGVLCNYCGGIVQPLLVLKTLNFIYTTAIHQELKELSMD